MEQVVLAMTVAYDGTGFRGFARQPGLPTIQGSIEDALSTALRVSGVETVGAGRTDAGVHALGQVVSFTPPSPMEEEDIERLARSVNALTPLPLVAKEIRSAGPGFSARFDALRREYRYRIVTGGAPPAFLGRYSWWVRKDLDADAMRSAAVLLKGEHDFRSFCVTESAEDKNTVRRVESIGIAYETHLGEECLVLRIIGNAFLHSMVRIIVGTLVEVGIGRKPPEWVGEVLSAEDRAAAGQTAPPEGLTFWRVEYPEDVWV